MRHKAWVERQHSGTRAVKRSIWKPKKRHRTSVLSAIKNLDRQLRIGTAFGGIGFIIPEANCLDWSEANWRAWPGMLCTSDQGSDMLSAGHCIIHHLKGNLVMVWDWAHGAQRDLTLMYQQHDLFKYALIFLVCINVYSGPDIDEGMRFQQLTAAMDHYLGEHKYNESFLFQHKVEKLLLELGDSVQMDEGDANLQEALWRFLKEGIENYRKFDRVKMAQFMGWINRARIVWHTWEQELFKREYIALECGMLDEKAASAIDSLPKSVRDHAANLRTTSLSATQADTKLLRSSTVNNLAMSVCFMESNRNKRVIAMMVFYPEPLSKWQGQAAARCRSVDENLKWLLEGLADGFTAHLNAIMKGLEDSSTTTKCGFIGIKEVKELENDTQGAIEVEDEFAELAGMMCVGLCARRRRRLFYMTSMWPNRAVSMLVGDEVATNVAEELRYDHKVYNDMEAVIGKGVVLEAQFRRSAFNSTAVQQLIAGHGAHEWAPHTEIKELVRERWSGLISSIIIEEANNIMKNSRQARGSMKFRRPERALAAVLSASLVDKRNGYKKVIPNIPVPQNEPKLHQVNAFGKAKDSTWIDKQGISSTTQAAPYWSPTAENVGQPGADARVWRDAHRFNRLCDVEFSFMGAFCDYKHCVIFRRAPGVGHRSFGWHYPLTHFQDSGALALPCHLRQVPRGGAQQYISFSVAEDEASCFGIFDWAGITAMRCRWRSPAWQGANIPTASWGAGVRLFPTGPEEPLVNIAAREAWWSIGMVDLKKIAGRLGIVLPATGSLFDIVMKMVEVPLRVTPDEASDIVAMRLSASRAEPDEANDIIMNCDEAAQCLDQQDERLIKKEQRSIASQVREFNSFEEDFKVAATKRAKANKSKAKASRKRGSNEPSVRRLDKVALSMASQAEAKQFMPEGGFLWKARATSSWYSRVPPLKSHSRTVSKPDALYWVICKAWQDWCLLRGVALAEAPVEGIEAAVQGLEAEGA